MYFDHITLSSNTQLSLSSLSFSLKCIQSVLLSFSWVLDLPCFMTQLSMVLLLRKLTPHFMLVGILLARACAGFLHVAALLVCALPCCA